MKKNILLVEDFTDVNFLLLGIKASLEMYRLAYFINKHINVRFELQEKEIDFLYHDCEAKFLLYHYYSVDLHSNFFLVANTFKAEIKNDNQIGRNLFSETITTKTKFLLPELKHADFFLKIEEDSDLVNLKQLRNEISQIKQVSSAFIIKTEQIQSPQNLIFN